MSSRKTPREIVTEVGDRWLGSNKSENAGIAMTKFAYAFNDGLMMSETRQTIFTQAVEHYFEKQDPFLALQLIMFSDNHGA